MNPPVQRNWKEILFNRRMVVCVFLGFTSGMPLFVLFQLVPAWLRSGGVDLATIGLFALVSLPYTWKFLWSPLMDRFRPPFLGRRRGWALVTQIALFVVIGALGHVDPAASLQAAVALVFLISLFSASQDIVIDAFRIESGLCGGDLDGGKVVAGELGVEIDFADAFDFVAEKLDAHRLDLRKISGGLFF